MAETFIFKTPDTANLAEYLYCFGIPADTTVIFPFNSVIIDLADFYTGINSDGLHTEDFRRSG